MLITKGLDAKAGCEETPTVVRRRELAHRVVSGLDVTLYWNEADNSTSIEVRHIASGTTLRSPVQGEKALDAFYHPLAHIKCSTAP